MKHLWAWLDQHPHSYWIVAIGATFLLAGWIARAARREARTGPEPAGWLDPLVLFLFILAWRWPFLFVAHEFNPDESQFVAGAMALGVDPVFWRSVDGGTAGPLDFYALLPLHWLGLPLDYFSARLTGLLLITGAVAACLFVHARAHGRVLAWLGILPVAVFFATVTHHDYLQYSSETLPLALVAGAILLLAGRPDTDRWRLYGASFLCGSIAFAKLQFVPIGAVLGGWAWWQAWHTPNATPRSRLARIGISGLAALAPAGVALVGAAVTGQLEVALQRYVVFNLLYVDQGNDRSLGEFLAELQGAALLDGRLPWLLGCVAVVTAIWLVFSVRRRLAPSGFAGVSAGLLLAAVIGIVTPRREFLHYVLLLPIPLAAWLGATAGAMWEQLRSPRPRLWLAGVLLVLGCLLPVISRVRQPLPEISGGFGYHWRHPRSDVAAVVHGLSRPGDRLAVWGWAAGLYVETGLPPATRDLIRAWSRLQRQQREHYLQTYLRDFVARRPALFVDAVGPGAFAFETRSSHAHEEFPPLADHVARHYALVRDLGNARIYLRNDLRASRRLSDHEIDVLLTRGRPTGRAPAVSRVATPFEQLARKEIGARSVRMIPPPLLVEWPLPATARAVEIEYGFDPVAHEQGDTNGAEIILELVTPDLAIRPVFHRLLDPVARPGDRGPQRSRVILPPFRPGTRLALRTTPGAFDNNAWDWVYLGALDLQQAPGFIPEQFPGYHRRPDRADAEHSALLPTDAGPILGLDAPATLTFVLQGGERHLQFDYGFRAGAYDAGGRTDGAILQVGHRSADGTTRVLFEHELNPVGRPEDRGLQRLDLALPADLGQGELQIRFDPGRIGNSSWDWTYLQNLKFD